MPRVAFLFPGQGAQYVGMGKQLAETIPAARHRFAEAAEVLGYDLLAVCTEGPAERLNTTALSQPAIFVASVAALEALRQSDPAAVEQCGAAAGLSLGEYTALYFAGSLSFADAVAVVRRRGEAMQAASEAVPGGMVSVLGLDADQVNAICQTAQTAGPLVIANRLGPGNLVVSGTQAACAVVENLVAERGGKTVRLAVAGAFHSELMRPAAAALAAALDSVTLRPPRVPVYSNVDAAPHTDPEEIRALLIRQVVQPVLWEQCIRNLLAAGFDKFWEIGPGRVLAGLLKRIQRKIDCVNVAA